ncbi:MAG TPA: fumarylacetoacetate hydrolase family protein [Steroidobacteraceae bacterium]|nr:fumarylacetoacetate hydrolase family protein [Steroidobacteraceae bacterium]
MKLASLPGGRDGRLAVVSRDLTRAMLAQGIAGTLQGALDDWARKKPALEALARELEAGRAKSIPFNHAEALSPLPRAFHWVDGSAYVNHVELVRKARGATMPDSFWTDPLVYQGGSDDFLPPQADVPFASEDWGIDLEGEVAVVTDDVPVGTAGADARARIQLVMLANDWSLRNLIPAELAKGFGFYQSKPATAFSPVAVTLDELGDAWRDARVHLPLVVHVNGKPFGRPNAGVDMTFDFGQLIAHAAKTRRLGAGSIVGSGTVSNVDRATGSTCLAERRMLETLDQGKPMTPFLSFDDRVRIEMQDAAGRSIFGAIDQRVVKAS